MTRETASFDVFDTVLTRIWGEPRDLFVQLGEQFARAGLSPLPPMAFAAERCAAEQGARRTRPSAEVTLEMIYAQLARTLGWSDTQQTTAASAEIELEAAGIRAVPAAVAAVSGARRAGRQIVFLSDMYLPATVVRDWLARAGAFETGDLLFISGECGAGKGDGRLFELARQQAGGTFALWTHTGDNPFSDIERPRRLGIQAQRATAAQLTTRELRIRGKVRFAAPWRSLVAGAAREARLARPAQATSENERVMWETGTAVAGPLFWAFTDWSLRDAEQRGLDDLYFLARGGQIFLRIAQAIQAVRPSRVRCHYLATSRLAFAGIGDRDDPARLRQLIDSPLAFHSVWQACANVGLTASTEILPPAFPPAEWERNLNRPERQALADWFLAPARRLLLDRALDRRERLARAYLEQVGLQRGARAGVVDTGWMGTIQRGLELLLGERGAPAPLTGYYLGLSPEPEFECAGDRLAYTNLFRRLRLRRETTHLILLELMARGDHGPLLGFAETAAGEIVPEFDAIDPASRGEAEFFQSAVLRFVQARLDAGVEPDAPAAELAQLVIGGYDAFYRHPKRAEAACFGRIPHADQMLEQRRMCLCPSLTLGEVLVAMRDYHQRPPGWWLQGQAAIGHSVPITLYRLLKGLKWTVKTRLLRESD